MTTQPGWVEFSNDLFKIEAANDDFNDNSVNTKKWVNSFVSNIVETNSRLELTTNTTSGYFNLDSNDYYDARSSFVQAKLLDAGAQGQTSFEAYPVSITQDGNNQVSWMISGNTVFARKKVAGVSTTVGSSFAYIAATHKYFRIRESGGTTFWDYSTDGLAWTNQTSVANPITMTAVKVGPIVGTWQNEGSTGTMKLDDFNLRPFNAFHLASD